MVAEWLKELGGLHEHHEYEYHENLEVVGPERAYRIGCAPSVPRLSATRG